MTNVWKLLRLTTLLEFLPVLLVSLMALFTGLALLGASAWLVASAALMPPLYTLALGITTVRACGIGRAVFRYGERYLSHRMAFRILTEIRTSFYDRAAKVLPLRSGPARQGEFLHDLLTGADELRDFYVRALLPIAAIGTITALTTWLLAGVIGLWALALPALYLARLVLSCASRQTGEERQRTRDAAYRSALLDAAGGADELICAGRDPALKRLSAPAHDLLEGSLQLARTDARRDAAENLLDTTVLMALLVFLILRVTDGALSGIDLCVYFLVLQTLLVEFRTLPEAVRQGRRSLLAAHFLPERQTSEAAKTDEPAEQPEKIPTSAQADSRDADAASQTLLEAKDLSFSYRQGQGVLQGLSFRIARGQHTAIIGASGAGKTTLAELLLGVWPPDSGTLRLCGTPYHELPQGAIQQAIAALPQGSVLFAGSIRENFTRYRPACKEEDILAALRDAQLSEVVAALPQGIDTPLGEDACFLSGGQRGRLLTAIAIAGREPIVLLDEPTCGLDQETAAALMAALFARIQETGQTLLTITHERTLVTKFQQTIELRK
ncbi:thiol reductant ABC exporter subunit CydC [Mitsuokella multacida]|uniref:thiol reductant ABC exporter subunit CydC n=1 Tax=Mitsuokella multacida TaxID=52226 RepID=UPI0022E96592|nr:thiol reductant ABC exporter subunit CydC [Mitsuokella multacida]